MNFDAQICSVHRQQIILKVQTSEGTEGQRVLNGGGYCSFLAECPLLFYIQKTEVHDTKMSFEYTART